MREIKTRTIDVDKWAQDVIEKMLREAVRRVYLTGSPGQRYEGLVKLK